MMNARELIQNLKAQIDMESELAEKNVKVDIMGTAREAKAQIVYEIEGRKRILEVTANDLGVVGT